MPKIEYIDFKPWHLKMFKAGYLYDKPGFTDDMRAWLYRQVKGVTILLDGEIAAIMGIIPAWNGMAEVTMIPSDVFYRHKKTCIRVCRELLALSIETFNLHRVQATTMADHPEHGRFLEFLGFEVETRDKDGNPQPMLNYGPNKEPFYQYAYIPVEHR